MDVILSQSSDIFTPLAHSAPAGLLVSLLAFLGVPFWGSTLMLEQDGTQELFPIVYLLAIVYIFKGNLFLRECYGLLKEPRYIGYLFILCNSID